MIRIQLSFYTKNKLIDSVRVISSALPGDSNKNLCVWAVAFDSQDSGCGRPPRQAGCSFGGSERLTETHRRKVHPGQTLHRRRSHVIGRPGRHCGGHAGELKGFCTVTMV